ncbi:hypothetical protein P5705_10340 [Pseudomonas entomophila]|uniref:hypothetical protein n=1 Tax=Pseudomonas entomophila TaxID=312306 RepID=UPI0024073E73|nr:hypothetical protein [Pseudomonas entomophila]MDF9618042.1 hypothetical protein [Pseudomonas entomophila]
MRCRTVVGKMLSKAAMAWVIGLLPMPDAYAMSGLETAIALNQRVAATPERCMNNTPEDACSGVLMRPMSEAHQREFWRHDSLAQWQQYEAFQLLRRDGKGVANPERSGYILHAGIEASTLDKPYQVVAREGNEVRVAYWDDKQPKQLAVQAIYYQPGLPEALLRAQRSQLAWFQATGQWLPVLRYVAGDLPFGFAQSEQLYNGYAVAKAINERYTSKDTVCAGGRARFYCNGVWVRTVDNDQYKAWNPVPTDFTKEQGVSFAYFAHDTSVFKTYKAQGFVLFASEYPVTTPILPMCVYPFDAGTRLNREVCSFRGRCGALQPQSWLATYRGRPYQSCAYLVDETQFQLSVETRYQARAAGVGDAYGWNELMLGAWAQNIPAQLPIQAFIHSDAVYSGANGLVGARKFQRQYVQETGRYLPVLSLRPSAPGNVLVTYVPEEQEVQ